MKKLLIICSVLILSSLCFAQTTSVSATITDPSGQIWSFGTFAVDWQRPASNQGTVPTVNGIPITEHGLGGNLSSLGTFTIVLADSHLVLPSGGQWVFTICPFASSQCYVINSDGQVTGASVNLSTFLNSNINNPSVNTTNFSRAYKDSEIATPPPKGGFYYDITLNCLKVYNGISFSCVGTSLPPVGGGTGLVTTNLPGGGTPGVCAEWVAGGALGNALSGLPCGAGGGGGLPAGIPGQQVVYVGPGSPSTNVAGQDKPVYDVRDYGLVQDGTTDDTAPLTTLLGIIGTNKATVMFTGTTALESVVFPPNVKVKFERTGQLKPISSATPLGGAGFVQGTGISNVNVLTSSCSVTLNGMVAGNTIIFMEIHHFTSATLPFGSVTDTQGGFYTQLMQQGFNLPDVNSAWAKTNIPGGSATITVPYKDNLGNPISVANGCIAWEISGMGTVVASESSSAGAEVTPTTTMSSLGAYGSAPNVPTTAGSLVIGFGGQSFINEASCTPGGGYTQPAGSAGYMSGGSQPITGKGFNFCAAYKLVSPGGNQNPTQVIPTDPKPTGGWSYAAMSIIPASSIINIQGAIDAAPQQIVTNALAGQGTLALDNNYIVDKVFPEWWGASPNASAAINTPALQAAIVGAFGSNRSNGSQANGFNRELRLMGRYNVNGTLSVNHMNGFIWSCQERLSCGFNQTATNASIINSTTGGTYGEFRNISWSTTASQDINHPLVDLNYTGVPSVDLVTQFIDFDKNNWSGAFVGSIGFRVAAAGGGAQGSNIYFYDNEANGFTEAAYMIGAGSNCVPTVLATNSIAVGWYGGDMQSNNNYGIEWFGGGMLKVDGTTFENGYGTSTNIGVQNGYDICGDNVPAGESFQIDNARTESLYFLNGGPYNVSNSFAIDQAFNLDPGGVPGVNTVIQGSKPAGHGKYYNVTVSGTWTGIGTVGNPLIATSGTGTTLVNTNQSVTGTNTIKIFQKLETVTQAVTGSTATILNVPISVGQITGSVTSGTIGTSHVMTQAVTGITCTSVAGASGTQNLQVQGCSGTADNSHIWTDGTTGGTYTPTAAPAFPLASPTMIITSATGAPDNSHAWTGSITGAVLVPTTVPTNTTNMTPNAWVGWYLTLLGGVPNAGNNQYCIITANGTQDFTCAAGWLTDFPDYITITNPDNTSIYIVEPQWGTQVTNGSVTWTALTKKIGTFNTANNVFIPGLQIVTTFHPVLNNFQVTRADWMGTGFIDNTFFYPYGVVLAGPTVGTGVGSLGQSYFYRQKYTRNGITETGYPLQNIMGTSVHHWQSGQLGGGQSYVDIYQGADNNAGAGIKKGRYFLENNSSGTPFFWYFNSDGTSTMPGGVTTTGASQIRTNNAANTDLTGELNFAGVTTATFTFVNTYTSHPECSAEPQFDPGAGNYHWITYTGTVSFTINWAAVVTGNVSYKCIGRN